eukprot:3915488-Pyramimonas_sp.AAC.1
MGLCAGLARSTTSGRVIASHPTMGPSGHASLRDKSVWILLSTDWSARILLGTDWSVWILRSADWSARILLSTARAVRMVSVNQLLSLPPS